MTHPVLQFAARFQAFSGCRVLQVACLVGLLTVPAGPLFAQEDASAGPDPQLVGDLIDTLGSSDFAARERAAEQLYALGRGAIPLLNQARKRGVDPEQNLRLRTLIRSLELLDLDSRIESFLDGGPADLENWDQMESLFGDRPRSRELFVELIRDYPEMVAALDGDPQEFAGAMARTQQRLIQYGVGARRVLGRADLLALLMPTKSPAFRGFGDIEMFIISWLNHGVADEFRNDPEMGDAFVGLVANWMGKSQLGSRTYVLRKAMEWEMQIGRKIAIETLVQRPTAELHARCLQTIARQGTMEDVALIAESLDDDRRLSPVGSMGLHRSVVEVGDVAAACIAYLNSVPVTEIGFAEPIEHEVFGILFEQISFPGDEEIPFDEPQRFPQFRGQLPLSPEIEKRRKQIREKARKLVPAEKPGEGADAAKKS